jgi:hypothetical protein
MWTVGRFGRFFGVAAGRRSPAQMQPYPIRTPEPDGPPLGGDGIRARTPVLIS